MTERRHPQRDRNPPVWPARVGPELEPLLQIVSELDTTQWWSQERLLELQQMQLSALLNHARDNTDYYSAALKDFDSFEPGQLTDDFVGKLPIADKQVIQTEGHRFVAREHDPGHGPLSEHTTSGSVSRPVTIIWNQYAGSFVLAKTFRYHQWHGSDPAKKMLTLRVTQDASSEASSGIRTRDWYPLIPGGELVAQNAAAPIEKQIEWLQEEDPEYLFTYPSNASELLRYARENGIQLPRLERIDVFGEMMIDDLTSQAREVFDCAVADKYSSREIGEMATRCPVSGLYHIQSETVYLEVRRPDGALARDGEVGQIIVTNLHNTAMPIIRYAIDDYAEVGPKCPCGRGLPTLRRILGRSRNMLQLENGDHIWMPFTLQHLCDVAPVSQIQLVQTAINEIRVLVVPQQTLDDDDKDALCEQLWTVFPGEMNLTVASVTDIPRSKGGKFELFRSEIGTHERT